MLVLALLGAPAVAQDDDDSAAPTAAPTAATLQLAPPPPPADPEQLWATARQVTLPAWSALTEAALARTEAARSYFDGELPIEAAFVDLGRGPHESLAWLSAQLGAIDQRHSDRLRQRASAAPGFGDERRSARWRAARTATLDAEDLADAQERRLLLALRSLATDHPSIAGAEYAAERQTISIDTARTEATWVLLPKGPERQQLGQRIAASHARIARLDAIAAAARRWATVPGAEPPSPDPELDALAGPSGDRAFERVQRLRPLLGDGERHRVDTALLAWLQDTRLPAAEVEVAQARASGQGSLVGRQASILANSTALASMVAAIASVSGQDPVSVVQRRVLELRREAAALRLAAAQAAVTEAAAASSPSDSQVEATAAAGRAEIAKREAERAAREAHDAHGRRIAGALEEVATVEAEAQTAWAAINAREAALQEELGVWQRRLTELDAEVASIAALPPGVGGQRRTRSGAAWADLHAQITSLRRGAIAAGAAWSDAQESRHDVRRGIAESRSSLAATRTFSASLPEAEQRGNLSTALDQWASALDTRRDAADRGVEIARLHRDAVLNLLQDQKRLRDRVRGDVPGRALARDRQVLFRDLELELGLVVPNLNSLVRRRLASLAALPRLFQELDRLWALLVGSLWLLVALATWLWGRSRVDAAITPLLTRLQDRRAELFRRSFAPLREPLGRVARAAIDLFAVSLLLTPVRDRVPELALLLVLFRLVALYRLFDGLFRLVVAPMEENRPALVALPQRAWDLAVRATRLLFLWLILGNFVQHLCRGLLGADALAEVLATVFLAAFVGLSLLLLYQAEPHLRAGVARAPESTLQRWLARPPGNPIVTRAPRGLLSLGLLSGVRVWQLLQGNVDENSALGTILNVVNRRWLAARDGGDVAAMRPIDPSTARRLDNRAARDEIASLYPELDTRFTAAWQAWREEQARGLVLLVGDRGQGKQVWSKRTMDRIESEGTVATRRARLGARLVDSGLLFAYLSQAWGLGTITDAAGFQAAIKALPPTCFLVEEIEFAFLRRVGGFTALRTFFQVVTSTSSEHFWLLTVHAPAWRLLERIGTVANPNSFRSVLEIPRLGGVELGQYLGLRTTSAGFRPDFSALSSSTPAGQPVAELERTAEAFFRLLAEASGGNPGIAIPMWTQSLCYSDDRMLSESSLNWLDAEDAVEPALLPRVVVRLPEAISNPTLPPLSDAALLTLAAVRVHGFLTIEDIVEANNMEPDLVRTTAQVLESLGLMQRVDGRYCITMAHLPAVTRLLRRRHFVYGKDQA